MAVGGRGQRMPRRFPAGLLALCLKRSLVQVCGTCAQLRSRAMTGIHHEPEVRTRRIGDVDGSFWSRADGLHVRDFHQVGLQPSRGTVQSCGLGCRNCEGTGGPKPRPMSRGGGHTAALLMPTGGPAGIPLFGGNRAKLKDRHGHGEAVARQRRDEHTMCISLNRLQSKVG